MRNWNSWCQPHPLGWSYPGFDRTYEELKLVWRKLAETSAEYLVLIVPMRNWNYSFPTSHQYADGVLIVPMRNWNPDTLALSDTLALVFWSYLWGIETAGWYGQPPSQASVVLIIPMRNWNHKKQKVQQLVLAKVLIVPMRNWNQKYSGKRTKSLRLVLIVPMRNWN